LPSELAVFVPIESYWPEPGDVYLKNVMTLPLWLSEKLAVIVIDSPTKNVDGDVDRSPLSGPTGDVAAIEAWVRATEPIMMPATAPTNTTRLVEILMAHLP